MRLKNGECILLSKPEDLTDGIRKYMGNEAAEFYERQVVGQYDAFVKSVVNEMDWMRKEPSDEAECTLDSVYENISECYELLMQGRL